MILTARSKHCTKKENEGGDAFWWNIVIFLFQVCSSCGSTEGRTDERQGDIGDSAPREIHSMNAGTESYIKYRRITTVSIKSHPQEKICNISLWQGGGEVMPFIYVLCFMFGFMVNDGHYPMN